MVPHNFVGLVIFEAAVVVDVVVAVVAVVADAVAVVIVQLLAVGSASIPDADAVDAAVAVVSFFCINKLLLLSPHCFFGAC